MDIRRAVKRAVAVGIDAYKDEIDPDKFECSWYKKVQNENAWAHLMSDRKYIYLGIPGTKKSIKDWMHNADFKKNDMDMHDGCFNYLMKIADDINVEFCRTENQGKKLIAGCHSLGGQALIQFAKIAQIEIERIVPFANPAAGGVLFNKNYQPKIRERIVQVVNAYDPVTLWPLSRMGYQRLNSDTVYFDADGRLSRFPMRWYRVWHTIRYAIGDGVNDALELHNKENYGNLINNIY